MQVNHGWVRTVPRAAAVVATAAAVLILLAASNARAELLLRPDSPLGAHAMLFYDTPLAADRDMFGEAAAEGAGTIRLDIYLPQITNGNTKRDWSWPLRIRRLAWQYGLRVVADLTGMPAEWASCPDGLRPAQRYRCPARSAAEWGALAGQVAQQLRGVPVTFEIWNEPDGSWTYLGTPQQYGQMLAASASAIASADPGAGVTNGGIMNAPQRGGIKWLRAALAAAGSAVWQHLSFLGVHLRGLERNLGTELRQWRHFTAVSGRPAIPIWVTETGYPANPAYQSDRSFRGGEDAQARYVAAALHDLYAAGAAKIFVTQRDEDRGSGPYASEGVLAGVGDPVPNDPSVRRRPAFFACQAFATQHLTDGPVSAFGVTVPNSSSLSKLLGPGPG